MLMVATTALLVYFLIAAIAPNAHMVAFAIFAVVGLWGHCG
jgi:hypothetical protein